MLMAEGCGEDGEDCFLSEVHISPFEPVLYTRRESEESNEEDRFVTRFPILKGNEETRLKISCHDADGSELHQRSDQIVVHVDEEGDLVVPRRKKISDDDKEEEAEGWQVQETITIVHSMASTLPNVGLQVWFAPSLVVTNWQGRCPCSSTMF